VIGQTAEGATLSIRVTPGSSRDRIVGPHGDALKVAVRQPPEKGRANQAVEKLLADAVGAAPREVSVLRGQTSRDKVVLFHGWTVDALRAALVPLGLP